MMGLLTRSKVIHESNKEINYLGIKFKLGIIEMHMYWLRSKPYSMSKHAQSCEVGLPTKMVVHNIIIYLQFITIVAEKAPLLQFAIAPALFWYCMCNRPSAIPSVRLLRLGLILRYFLPIFTEQSFHVRDTSLTQRSAFESPLLRLDP